MSHEVRLQQFALACPKCGRQLEIAEEKNVSVSDNSFTESYTVFRMRDVVLDYLTGKEECCPNDNCRRRIDWWKIIVARIKPARVRSLRDFVEGKPEEKGSLTRMKRDLFGLLLAGAQVSYIDLVMRPEQRLTVDFRTAGIPENAKILSLEYLFYGGIESGGVSRRLVPLEDHLATHGLIRREIPHRVRLYPAPMLSEGFVDKPLPEQDTACARVLWAPPDLAHSPIASLLDAFDALYTERLRDVPIPAQIPVECALRDLLRNVFSRHMSREYVNGLLIKDLTFNAQLNAIYPLVLGLLNLPPLPNHIRGGVNTLTTARNSMAHGSRQDVDLPLAELAVGLTACLFTFKHISHVAEVIDQYTAPIV